MYGYLIINISMIGLKIIFLHARHAAPPAPGPYNYHYASLNVTKQFRK